MQKIIAPGKDWFKYWFDSSFYHQLYAERNEHEASAFIHSIVNHVAPLPGSKMLDLGCGKGRHSKFLAQRGFNVVGIDLSASSISHAKRMETSNLCFRRHDMRWPFGKNEYSYVFNLFTSFGYFKTEREDNEVVKNISDALETNGLLIMDYINSRYWENLLVPFERIEIDGVDYTIQRWTDEHFFFKLIEIERHNEPPHSFTERVKKFNLEDFESMFNHHGLQLQTVFGNYNLDKYDSKWSPRMILLAKKIS